ncbi:16203_t:CDS:2, partial [Cetraspora pellucida]
YISINKDSDNLTDLSDESFDLLIDSAILSKTSNLCLSLKVKFMFDSNNFNIFYSNLIQYVCNCMNDNNIKRSGIEISYKVNGHGQAIALKDSSDYDKSIENNDSDEEITRVKSKQVKHNHVLKETSLASDKIKLAKIILQLRIKYQYNIHYTPCYIEEDKYLQLIPVCLHL